MSFIQTSLTYYELFKVNFVAGLSFGIFSILEYPTTTVVISLPNILSAISAFGLLRKGAIEI